MTSVFLSYSAKDTGVARSLANELSRRGLQVWFDEREILVGDSILDRINEAIRSVDYLLVLLSDNSLKSSWVNQEIRMAFERFGEDANTIEARIRTISGSFIFSLPC